MVRRRLEIAVVGQGIMGLSSALKLAEQGHNVTIFDKGDSSQNCSAAAGAYWWPHRIYPESRVRGWAKETYDVYCNEADQPHSGVSFEKHIRVCIDPDDSDYVRHFCPDWRQLENGYKNIEAAAVYELTVPVITVPKYLPSLKQRVMKAGVTIEEREIDSLDSLLAEFNLVINCAGLGAKSLAGDPSVFPIRGQVVSVSQNEEVRNSLRVYQKQDRLTLILPRQNDIILGGTSQDDDWSLKVRDSETREIFERCRSLVPELGASKILGASAGLRPGRYEVRLELERRQGKGDIIHNYGHGGGGYTVFWGCANEVSNMVARLYPA